MSDSDQPKPKPPVRPTPHTTQDVGGDTAWWERAMFGAMALFVGIMMICMTILIVYATWLIVTTGGCGSFRK